MHTWWHYFTKQGTIATCKHCNYSKDLGPSVPTSCLKSHLKNKHPKEYQQKIEAEESRNKSNDNQQTSIKQAFTVNKDENTTQAEPPAKKFAPNQPSIRETLNIIGQCDKNGDKTLAGHRIIMHMIAVDLKPLSIVENRGFRDMLNYWIGQSLQYTNS
jgi:hypothetical protein